MWIEAVGEALGETRMKLRREYAPKIAQLEAKIAMLERQVSLESRFAELERHLDARQVARDESKRGSDMIPQSELLAKIEKLERQVDDLERVADLGASFRELAERVGELEKTNSLEARFTKLANEAKGGPEIQQSELLARVEGLQRQVKDFKKIANQPGPQGPPGAPGKLAHVKEYAAGRVHYEADVVTYAGALWQARGDTVHAPPHVDWVCLARAGRDGCDGRSANVCGTYDVREKYERLDIVALDGAAFIAKHDNPGISR